MAADESYPEDLRYHAEHDWARIEGEEASFGITWYAQEALGEVVFFEPPEIGTTVSRDEAYAEVESVKAVSDVIAPLSGEVIAVNDDAGENPEVINNDPYGDGWMVRVRLTDTAEVDSLLDVGPVTFPAYPDADVKVAQRSYQHFRDEQRRQPERAAA